MKIEEGKCEGGVDELIKFFNLMNLDAASALNVPRKYSIPSYLFWLCGLLYVGCLFGSYFFSCDVGKYSSNIFCLLSLTLCCLLFYLKFKQKGITVFLFIAGVVIYLFSTRGLTNEDIKDYTNRGFEKVLPIDSISLTKQPLTK